MEGGCLRIAAVVALVALLLLVAVAVLQRKLIYLPLTADVPPVHRLLPGAIEARFGAHDGPQLAGWFLPAAAAGARAAPAVLFCNGNAGNRAGRVELAAALHERGISVLLWDYRGYGGNAGRPTEGGLIDDARAARAWLEARPEVDPSRVVLAGESLGAAVALAIATERSPAGLVLRSPFTSLVEVGRVHYPILPVRWLLRDRWLSIERIEKLRCPLLVAAGARDDIVPAAQSRALFEAASVEPKRLLVLDDAGHNDLEWVEGPRWIEAVAGFVHGVAGEG